MIIPPPQRSKNGILTITLLTLGAIAGILISAMFGGQVPNTSEAAPGATPRQNQQQTHSIPNDSKSSFPSGIEYRK